MNNTVIFEFEAAVRAIITQNADLLLLFVQLDAPYHARAALPCFFNRLSRLLDCEANGAHKLLEDFATAAKKIPRGEFPVDRLDELLVSCNDLTFALVDLLADSHGCQTAIYTVQRTEERLVNYLKGVSGAGEPPTREKYVEHINELLGELKECFAQLGLALVSFEFALEHPTPAAPIATPLPAPPPQSPQKKRRMGNSRVRDSIQKTRRKDRLAAVAEIRRRVKGGSSYREAAEHLNHDPAWHNRLAHLQVTTLVRYAKG